MSSLIHSTMEPARRNAATGYCGNRCCGFQKGNANKHRSGLIKSFRWIDGELIFLAQPRWQCDRGGSDPPFCSALKWQQQNKPFHASPGAVVHSVSLSLCVSLSFACCTANNILHETLRVNSRTRRLWSSSAGDVLRLHWKLFHWILFSRKVNVYGRRRNFQYGH